MLRNIVEEHFDNDPDVTIAAAKQIRRMDRDYADVGDKLYALQIAKGNRLLDEDDLDGSWGQFDEAGALKPDAPEAPNGKRQVLLAKGWKEMERCYHACPDQAIDALEQIMQIDANFREARSKLYALYVSKADRLGRACDRDGAFPHLMRALEIYPEGGEAQQGLAVCTPTPIPTPPPAAPVQVPTVTPRVVLPTPPPPPPTARPTSPPPPTVRPTPQSFVPTPRPLPTPQRNPPVPDAPGPSNPPVPDAP